MPDNNLEKNIRDRMKHSGTGLIKYGTNVGKSFLHMGKYMVKTEMPTLFSYGEVNKDLLTDTVKVLRNPAQALGSKFSQVKGNAAYKSLTEIAKNAIDDIRTGKFYDETRDRTEIGMETEAMLNDFGGIDFSDYGSEGFEANESSIDKSDALSLSIAQTQEANADSRTNATVSAIGGAAGAIIDNQRAQHDMDVKIRMKHHDQSMTGMKNMTMASVANYEMTNTMMTEMLNLTRDASAEISQKLTDITTILEDIKKNTTATTQAQTPVIDDTNPFKNGVLDFKKYAKVVQKNVDTRYDISGLWSMLTQGMGVKDLLELYKSNPIGGLITTMIRGAAPKGFFKDLGDFDKTLKSFGPAALLRLGNMKNADGEDSILSLLGIKNNPSKKITTEYNMGKVDFTGKTDKAITEVIPMLLSSINSALTGNELKVYDYRAGRFVSATGEMASLEAQLNSHSGSYSARNKMSSSLKYVNSDLINTNEKLDKFEAAIDKLFDKITEDQSIIDLFSVDYGDRKSKAKMAELSSDIFGTGSANNTEKMNLLMGLMRSLSRKDLISIPMTTAQLGLDFEKKNQRLMNDLHERGLASIYSELDPLLEDYRRDVGNGRSRSSSKATLNKLRKDGGMLSSLPSILTDIRDILTRGIITYSYNLGELSPDGLTGFNNIIFSEQSEIMKRLSDKVEEEAERERDRRYTDNMARSFGDSALMLSGANARTIAEQVKAARIEEEERKRLSNIPGINGNLFSTKTTTNLNNLKTLVRSPFETILTTLDIAEGAMFKFLYGEDYGDVATLNSGGLFSAMSNMFTGLFIKTSNLLSKTIGDKFLEPITSKLFDSEKGIVTSFVKDKINPYVEKATTRAKSYLLGDKVPQLDDDGNPVFDAEGNQVYSGRAGGIFSSTLNSASGLKDKVLNKGKDYLGVGKDRSKSFLGKMDAYFFGEKAQGPETADGKKARVEGGLFDRIGKGIKGNFDRFNEFMFGTDELDGSPSKSRKLFSDIKTEVSQALPDTIVQAGIGAGAVAGMGMLTGLFLPGGPLLGGIIGGVSGLVTGSTKLKEFLFGEDGIDSELVDGFKKYAPKIGIGAGLGAIAGGFGLLPFGFGSMAGMLMGGMGGMMAASDQIKELLFGNPDDSSSGLLSKDSREKFLKDVLPVSLTVGGGAGLLASALSNGIGILPAIPFLPGGPVVGMVAGLTAAFNADRIKDFFFGQGEPHTITNPDGTKEIVHGKPGMFVRLFDVTKDKLFQPMIDGINNAGKGIASWFQESIVDQLSEAIDPMKQEIAKAKEHIAKAFRNIGDAIKGAFHSIFEKAVGLPMEDFAEKYIFKPLRENSKRLFSALGKIIGGLISAPFKLINAMFVNKDGEITEDDDVKAKIKSEREEKRRKRAEEKAEKKRKKAEDKLSPEQRAENRGQKIISGINSFTDLLRDIKDILLGKVSDISDKVNNTIDAAKAEGDATRERNASNREENRKRRKERREAADVKRQLKAETKKKQREEKLAKNEERKRLRREDRIRNMEEIDAKRDSKGRSKTGRKGTDQNIADTAHYTKKLSSFLESNISGIGYDVRYIRNMLLKQHGALGPGEKPEDGPTSGKVPKKYSLFARATSWLSDKAFGVKSFAMDKLDKAKGILGYILHPFRILRDGISSGVAAIKDVFLGAKDFLKGFFGTIGHAIKTTVDTGITVLGSAISGAARFIKEAAGGIGAAVGSIVKELGSALGGLLGVVAGVTQGIASFVKEAAPEMGKGLAKMIVGGAKLVGKGVYHGARFIGKGVVGGVKLAGKGIGKFLGIKSSITTSDGSDKKIGKVIGAYILGGSLDKIQDIKATISTKLDGIGTRVDLKQVAMLGSIAMSKPAAALPVYIAGSYDDQPDVMNTRNRAYRNINRDISTNSSNMSDIYDKLAGSASSKSDIEVLQNIHTFNNLSGDGSAGKGGKKGEDEDESGGGFLQTLADFFAGKGGAVAGGIGIAALLKKFGKKAIIPALLSGGAMIAGTFNAVREGDYGQAAENVGRAAVGLNGKNIASYAVRGLSANTLGPAVAKTVAGRAAAEGAEKTLIGRASRAIMSAIKKFFGLKLVIDKLGTAAASKLSNKLTRKIGETLSKTLLAKVAKSAIRLLGGAYTIAAFAIADFTTGFAQAANILKVRSSSLDLKMRLTAAVAKAVSGLTFGLITEDFIAEIAYSIIADDDEKNAYAQERAYMERQAADMGMELDEYNEQVANPTIWTKVKNFFKGGPSTTSSYGNSASTYGGKGPGTDHFVQTDSQWNTGPARSHQMSKVGCGPTVAAMMVSGGHGANPIEASQRSVELGYRDQTGGTDPTFFEDYGAIHGKPMQRGPVNAGSLKAALSSGSRVALMGADKSGGVFGDNMHYVMADGIDSAGNVNVKDPLKRGSKKYKLNDVLNGTTAAIYGKGPEDEAAEGGSSVMDGIASLFGGIDNALSTLVGKRFGIEPQSNSGSTGGASSFAGTNDEQKTWSFLKSKGLSDEAAAGIMGNLKAESGLNPKNLQNSSNRTLGLTDDEYTSKVDSGAYSRSSFINDKGGYGLAQWTFPTRKSSMFDFIKSRNDSIGSLQAQLEYLWHELVNNYGIPEDVKKAKSVEAASTWILKNYEKPENMGSGVIKARARMGQEYYDRLRGMNMSGGLGSAKQQDLVRAMNSIRGSINYSLSGPQDPDKGSASCASTVGWAYRKVLGDSGADGSFSTRRLSASSTTQSKDGRFRDVYVNNGKDKVDPATLQPGDIMYLNWSRNKNNDNMHHTEMYAGNGTNLSHGGPNKGPIERKLDNFRLNHIMKVRRYTGFLGKGSGSVDGYLDNIYSNQFGSARSINYKIGTDFGKGPNVISELAKRSNYRILKSKRDMETDITMTSISKKLDAVSQSSQESSAINILTNVMGEMLEVLKGIEKNTANPQTINAVDVTNNNNPPSRAVPTAKATNQGRSSSISAGTYMIDRLTTKV